MCPVSLLKINHFTGTLRDLVPNQTSKMEFFCKIVNGLKPSTVFAKNPSKMFDTFLTQSLTFREFCQRY